MSGLLISVIIPVYNSEPFLRRCVDGVLGQSFQGSFEVILVDDGSTDASGAICDEYASLDSRVRVFHRENRGASLARRYGLEMSEGEYVTFVDSDDCLEPDYLKVLYSVIEESGLSVAACGLKSSSDENASVTESFTIIPFEELMPRFFKYEFWGFWAKLYKRSALERVDFPEATISEDYNVMARLFSKERCLAYNPSGLYVNVRRPGSLSRQPLSKRSFEEFDNVTDVYHFTLETMPEYSGYALANAVGTVLKLLSKIKVAGTDEYASRQKELITFLRGTIGGIIVNKHLSLKQKLLAFKLMV